MALENKKNLKTILDSEPTLSENARNLLLATRLFGRGTAFPHELTKNILIALDETAIYQTVIQELHSQNCISSDNNLTFELSQTTRDWIHFKKVPPDIWIAAIKATLETVPSVCTTNNHDVLELMMIHADAIANTMFFRDKKIYIPLMYLSVQCMTHLGRSDEAKRHLEYLENLAQNL